jgi:hypothetical protein
MRFSTSVVLGMLVLPAVAGAQRGARGVDTLSLLGRSAIMAEFGLTGARDATQTATRVETHTSGELGSLVFKHWFRPQVAFEMGIGVMNADETVTTGFARTNAIMPLLFGLSVSPASLAISSSVRPYLSAAAGPYFHSVSVVSGLNASTTTESAAGARFGLGANWFVARHFIVDVQGDYHAVGSFDHPDAVTDKPSGFGLTVGLGFSWGGRY